MFLFHATCLGVVARESPIHFMSAEGRDAGANLRKYLSVLSLLVVAGNFNHVVGG